MSRGAGRGNSGEQVSLLILLSKPPQAPSGRLSLGPEPRLSPSLIAPLATCPAPPLPVPRHQGDDAHHLGVAMGRGPDSQTPPPPRSAHSGMGGGPFWAQAEQEETSGSHDNIGKPLCREHTGACSHWHQGQRHAERKGHPQGLSSPSLEASKWQQMEI